MKKICALFTAIFLYLWAALCVAETIGTQITVSVGGDCVIGCLEEHKQSVNGFKHAVEEYGYDWFFKDLLTYFGTDDMTLVNCECTFTESTDKQDKLYNFKAPAEYINILKLGSVECVNIANNHTYDYGLSGLTDTKQNLTDYGIMYSGNDDIAVYETKGVKIGMVGKSYPFDKNGSDIKNEISLLREKGCQIVIATFHWGTEYEYYANNEQKNIAHKAIDDGADIVIGHHPHVVQGIEIYNGKHILYSLGNLVFGGNTDPKDRDAYIAQIVFDVTDTNTSYNVEVIPVRLTEKSVNTDYKPIIAQGEQKDAILAKINKYSK